MIKKDKINDLNIIKQAAKLYKENLLDKNILFVYLKNNNINFYEVTFLQEHFKHLTGVISKLNAYQFFYKAKSNRLKLSDFDYKDNTTKLKINNLIKSMLLKNYVKMIGEFKHNKVYLSINKLAGNNNLIIGFDKGEKINYPKTLLKGDIRDYSNEKPCRIIAILSKNINNRKYDKINYLAKNISINRLLNDCNILEKIDIEKIHFKNNNYGNK